MSLSSGNPHWARCVWLLLLCGGACSAGVAQTKDASVVPAKLKTSKAVEKPAYKPRTVSVNDSIVKITPAKPREAEAIIETPATSDVETISTTAPSVDDRIASLKKQIEEKQKRIYLLIRLFVNDEKDYLKDPQGAVEDVDAQDRRHYAQKELRWETAELAKLKADLESLTSTVAGK